MSIYTQAWIIFGAMFGATEGAALISKAPGASLSAHLRKWFSLRDKATGWKWRRGSLAVFLGWLIYHLFFQ